MADTQEPKAQEYAQEHLRFLEQNRPDVLAAIRRSGDLNSYLSSVGDQASDRFLTLMMQHKNSPEVAKLPYQARVTSLQSRRREADELVRHDLIHQPLKD